MPIVQQGAINTTALTVPDIYVQIVPPQFALNGVPSNVLGLVGTAIWGPVNRPTVVGSLQGYMTAFGSLQNRKYDMGTHVDVAARQGAAAFCCVRQTDGTDAKAAVTIASKITFTALYSGTLGNSIVVTIAAGSAVSSWKVTVTMPGFYPEVFDNISGTGNALWVAMAAAINAGNSVLRGPSSIITATALSGTAAPTAGANTLAGGTDGAGSVTAATLVGADATTSGSGTGMYALRGQKVAIGVLCDADDSTQWTNQVDFGLSEGVYMVLTTPAGDTIVNAQSTVTAVDSYAVKMMFGDWLYWYDQTNSITRLVSPQPFAAGILANLSPEQSSLNKPLYGIQGSQKSGAPGSPQRQTYATAELSALAAVGCDVICQPAPGGRYYAVRIGHNSSSNAAVNGDNYTRMTNYLSVTLADGMGYYVGQVINADHFRQIKATIDGFMVNLYQQGLLGSTDGTRPWSVVCDVSNNPQSRTALGYVQADVAVRYMGINEKFLVNLQGGTTVTVQRASGLN